MSYQITKLDLIPKGEKPVCNTSQFDNGRILSFEIYENGEAYKIPNDVRVELHCSKPDGNIVTVPSDSIIDNNVTFISTTQLTACFGDNLCEISLYGPDDYLIGSLNFTLEVERDPLLGGINSTSAIHDLHEQIEAITEDILSENYYNKTELDDLLDLKANTSDVYTKAQVDSVLDLKANTSDVYTKAQVDSVLDLKANTSDVYTKVQVDSALDLKANTSDVYTKAQVDNIILGIMPVDVVSGAIAIFNTEIEAPLKAVIVDIVATGGNGTPDNPIPIVGFDEANISANGIVHTIVFGQTVYGGVLDVTRGKLTVTHKAFVVDNANVIHRNNANSWYVGPSDGQHSATAQETVMSDKFAQGQASNQDVCFMHPNGLIRFNTSIGYATKEDLFTAIGTINFVYPLETPFDIDLTPEQIEAIVGTNNVYADCGYITVEFKTSIEDYINSHTGVNKLES